MSNIDVHHIVDTDVQERVPTSLYRTYRIDRSYDWNYEHGPSFAASFPVVPATPQKRFLGLPVNSRLGIAAGLLLNSTWIEMYGRLGFDILTYKTVRSRSRRCYSLPNWVWIDGESELDPMTHEHGCQTGRAERDTTRITSSVSFGMPSKAPEVWMADVARTRQLLHAGQVLVVSVVASPQVGEATSVMIEDFARLAAMACEAGAQVIEANLSCPNVCTAEGDIFQDAELSGRIATAMQQAAGSVPIMLKIGYIADQEKLMDLLRSVTGKARAVILVNGVSQQIQLPSGQVAFGTGRESAGILGRLIHEPGVESVHRAMEYIRSEQLDLEVVGVGGVSSAQDADDFFQAGAHAVLMGSAPMYDPFLAVRIKSEHPEW
jgi:dihydroorotate dehydrogenase